MKTAFLDEDLKNAMQLTSANSINVARFLPQAFYYFNAYARIREKGIQDDVVISVPSGNFGNLTAGLFAKKMGLPVKRFIAANNENDIVFNYLQNGKYEPRASVATIANAMDVGDPSNLRTHPRFVREFACSNRCRHKRLPVQQRRNPRSDEGNSLQIWLHA